MYSFLSRSPPSSIAHCCLSLYAMQFLHLCFCLSALSVIVDFYSMVFEAFHFFLSETSCCQLFRVFSSRLPSVFLVSSIYILLKFVRGIWYTQHIFCLSPKSSLSVRLCFFRLQYGLTADVIYHVVFDCAVLIPSLRLPQLK